MEDAFDDLREQADGGAAASVGASWSQLGEATEIPGAPGRGGQAANNNMTGLRLDHFYGSRNPVAFRDWKTSLEAIRILSGLPDEKLSIYAWLSLRGEAKESCRHLSLAELGAGGGYRKLVECLEARFERQTFENYEHWHRKYEKFKRTSGMTMAEYLQGLNQAKVELEVVDKDAAISEMSSARKMLNGAGLSKEEQRMTFVSAGANSDPEKFRQALMMTYSDCHLEDKTKKERRLLPPSRTNTHPP